MDTVVYVHAGVVASRTPGIRKNRAVETLFRSGSHYYVYDSSTALGSVLGGRIADYFYPLDIGGRQLTEGICTCLSCHHR